MKTLFVFPAYEPAWAFGGTVSSNVNLCKAMAKHGVAVVVYTTNADGKGGHLNVPLNEPIILDGVEVWYFNCDLFVQKGFYSRGLNQKLKKTVSSFDMIHVAAIWQFFQFDVYRSCKYFSKPYVVSTHGSLSRWPLNQNKIRKRLYWHLFGKTAIKHASGIRFTAEDERVTACSTLKALNETPGFIIPNGIEINNIKRHVDLRKSLNISDNKFVLLYTGRIHKKKGIHLVFEALKKLNDSRFLFLIAGPKEDMHYTNYLIKLSNEIRDSIIWHDPVSRDKIWDFYYSSNLLVLPSYDENFGMIVVEAMACEVPVMITRNVAIWREIQADEAGVIVNQDADEIAEAIKKLADDTELLNRMKQNARKSAEDRYDINKVASFMIKAYEDILTGRRSPELQWK
jgi:Glycosyltransferase